MYREEVNIYDDDNNIILTLKGHPCIIMSETGEIVLGCGCWWIPVADFVTANQMVLKEFGG